MGVLESMSASFSPVCGPLDDQILAELLLSSVNLLIGISATLHLKYVCLKILILNKPLL